MSNDLVKRAREYGDDPQDVSLSEWAEWSHKWADRIEELVAELAEYKHVASAIDKQWAESQDEIADLKANLAKTVKERDEAWKRAGYAEKMWGEAEVKLGKALEALDDNLR